MKDERSPRPDEQPPAEDPQAAAMGSRASQTASEPVPLLQLNKAALIEMLLQLKQADSIETLRRGVAAVRACLHAPDSRLRQPPSPAAPPQPPREWGVGCGGEGGDDAVVEYPQELIVDQLDQIAASHSLERAWYYVARFIKGISDVRTNAINDINLNRWKEYEDIYTDSLWYIERRDTSGVHRAGYWGNFIPQIPYQMMRRYTKKGDWVLDTFAGAGTTLIEAQRLGRHSIGIELQPDVAALARRLLDAEPNPHGVVREIVVGDSAAIDYRALIEQYGRQSVQLVMMHPPYFDIIKFSDDSRDFSNAGSLDRFLALMGRVVDQVAPLLDPGRYLAVVIGDTYARGEWIPLGFLVMNQVLARGFSLKSIVVKNFEATTGKRTQRELWRYRALAAGFYIFKHEYIFVFRKR